MLNNNSCYLCGCNKYIKRPGRVRDNSSLKIFECLDCGLVFLSSFDHIHKDFYENSGMHNGNMDIVKWTRETALDDDRRFTSLRTILENKTVLDFGCGNGGFLLRIKDIAQRVQGVEVDKSIWPWIIEKGIEILPNIGEINNSFDVITLFHVLEHFPDPRLILKILTAKLNINGQIIIEVPNADDALLKLYRNIPFSRFTYWSCHLFLFNQFTLSMLAKQVGLSINYIKQIQRYPLSNHLYWLANKKPGGHKKWNFLDSPDLNSLYEKQLAAIGKCDTIFASLLKS